jgi:hypothetical protein
VLCAIGLVKVIPVGNFINHVSKSCTILQILWLTIVLIELTSFLEQFQIVQIVLDVLGFDRVDLNAKDNQVRQLNELVKLANDAILEP